VVLRNTGRAVRRAMAEFRARCAADNVPCWMDGQPIDYGAPDWSTPDSFSLDHYWPVSLYPDVQTDPAGWRASHSDCNRRRGNRAPAPGLGRVSRAWL